MTFVPDSSAARIGIDTDLVKPDPSAVFALPSGRTLSRKNEVLTYVARNLEPYRGFHVFMRTLPGILRRRPGLEVVIVGADGVSYGRKLPEGETYKSRLLKEVGTQLDLRRVHFLEHLPYARYLKVLQISAAHVYLTYPFVLSWSLMEAMSAGCLVVGSETGPVTEVIRTGQNGLLTDFFARERLADIVCTTLDQRDDLDEIRNAARSTIVEKYDLTRVCVPAHRIRLDLMAGGEISTEIASPSQLAKLALVSNS